MKWFNKLLERTTLVRNLRNENQGLELKEAHLKDRLLRLSDEYKRSLKLGNLPAIQYKSDIKIYEDLPESVLGGAIYLYPRSLKVASFRTDLNLYRTCPTALGFFVDNIVEKTVHEVRRFVKEDLTKQLEGRSQ